MFDSNQRPKKIIFIILFVESLTSGHKPEENQYFLTEVTLFFINSIRIPFEPFVVSRLCRVLYKTYEKK